MKTASLVLVARAFIIVSFAQPSPDAVSITDLRRSAENGIAQAQNNLGSRYLHGDGVPQDYAEAAKWYRMAAEQGHPFAQASFGLLNHNGQGIPKDDAEAAKWYRKAANQGNTVGQRLLGYLYMGGKVSRRILLRPRGGTARPLIKATRRRNFS